MGDVRENLLRKHSLASCGEGDGTQEHIRLMDLTKYSQCCQLASQEHVPIRNHLASMARKCGSVKDVEEYSGYVLIQRARKITNMRKSLSTFINGFLNT